jgi:NADH:ubiquinone oxidoreductase subunit F (NADH-binding)
MGRRRVLLDGLPVGSLDDHVANGGGASLPLADELGPAGVLDQLERSGLRGRGGAGFPTALKWRSIAAAGPEVGERFVVANGAEGEPGTFKDRFLLRHNPYLMVEGLVVAARVVGARRAFIALKRSFRPEIEAVTRALVEMEQAGWLAGLEVTVVPGPSDYLFGEEKALLEVIEGEDPLPRLFPPYLYGLFTTTPQMGWSAGRQLVPEHREAANPTLVNNIETLSDVAMIVGNGSDWFAAMGTPESKGTILATVSGDTRRHGVDEFEMGTPVAEIISEVGGGPQPGRSIRYVLSGVSNPVLRSTQLDTPASYEAMEAAGSGLGSAGFIVYDDRTDPVELARAVSQFLAVESCGQCPACKLGCEHVTSQLSDALEAGEIDLGVLTGRLRSVNDAARCYLPTQEQRVVGSLVGDIRAMISGERRGLVTAPITDLVAGHFQVSGQVSG